MAVGRLSATLSPVMRIAALEDTISVKAAAIFPVGMGRDRRSLHSPEGSPAPPVNDRLGQARSDLATGL